MKAIREYYSDIGVPSVYSADVDGLLRLACIAELDANLILAGLPSREAALEDETKRFDVYFADELMTIAQKRLDVCMCIMDRGCDGACTSCVKAFEDMRRAEDELEILNK